MDQITLEKLIEIVDAKAEKSEMGILIDSFQGKVDGADFEEAVSHINELKTELDAMTSNISNLESFSKSRRFPKARSIAADIISTPVARGI